jgi:hypothetical protein
MEIKSIAKAEKMAAAEAEKAKKEAAEWMEGADIRSLKRSVLSVHCRAVCVCVHACTHPCWLMGPKG